MTRNRYVTPFDDPAAFDRRWSRLTEAETHIESRRDPLLFIADHLLTTDRRPGSLAIHLEIGPDHDPMVIVMADGPAYPPVEDCLVVLARAVEAVRESEADSGDFDDGSCPVRRLGLVTHRTGGLATLDVDRRWLEALTIVCNNEQIESLGLLVRLRSGALVRVPYPAAA